MAATPTPLLRALTSGGTDDIRDDARRRCVAGRKRKEHCEPKARQAIVRCTLVYTDDSGGHMGRGYSFRFYGRSPADWAEGANDGHGFSVQFERGPTDDELEKLGKLYELTLATGPAKPSVEPWRWSERFASFDVGERWSTGRAFLGAVTDFLMEARSIVPIRDVVYFNAREGSGRWDQWTLQQGPPDPGPDMGVALMEAYRREVDSNFPPPKKNDAYERGRAEGRQIIHERRTSRATEKADALTGAPPKGKVGLERTAVPYACREPEPWPDDATAAFDIPDPAFVQKEYMGQTYRNPAQGDHVATLVQQRPLAWVVGPHGGNVDIAWIDEGERRTPTWPEDVQTGGLTYVTLDDSGREALLVNEASALHVNLDTQAGQRIYYKQQEDGMRLMYAAFADEDRAWVILSEKRLHIFRPSDSGVQLVAQAKSGGNSLVTTRSGNVLVVGRNKPKVFGLAADKLKVFGTIAAAFQDVFEREGRILLKVSDDACYELTHLDEVLGSFLGKTQKPAAKKKATKAPVKRTVSLTSVDGEGAGFQSLQEEVDEASALIASIADGSWYHTRRTASGRVATLAKKRSQYASDYVEVAFVDAGGEPRSVDVESAELLELSADGKRAFVGAGRGIRMVELDSNAVKDVYQISTDAGPLRDMAVWGDDLFVLTEKMLLWLRVEEAGGRLIASAKVSKGKDLHALPENDALVALCDAKNKILVYDRNKEELRKLGQFLEAANRLQVVNGAVLVGGIDVWRIDGL
jgi:hypothetical protein